MKVSHLIGMGILLAGIVFLHKKQKRPMRNSLQGIVINPTAIFIWQDSAYHPKIDIFHLLNDQLQRRLMEE